MLHLFLRVSPQQGYCIKSGAVFGLIPPKGGDIMPITLTFHLFGLVFTLKIKWENRHSAK